MVEDKDKIIAYVTRYYEELYKNREVGENSLILVVIGAEVIVQQNETLISLPSEEEIYPAVCSIGASISLGPKGFSGGFYRKCWSIIKLDLVASIRICFIHGSLLETFNLIHVCLIPKTSTDDRGELFRPIAVVNF